MSYKPLSKREAEVLTHLAQGLNRREIVELTGLSLGTVNTYVERSKAKLGTDSVIAVVARAQAAGMIAPRHGVHSVKAAMKIESNKTRQRLV